MARDVKALVIACNTVSAVAPERLRVELDIPVLGVIEPGARAAVEATPHGAHRRARDGGDHRVGRVRRAPWRSSRRAPRWSARPRPLLVPLAEEGWTDGEVPRLAAARYIEPLARAGVDVVVLGCTHYPLLRDVIEGEARAQIGADVRVVDSAQATAADVHAFLHGRGLARTGRGSVELRVTDVPRTFREVASRFLGEEVAEVEQVDL